MTNLPKDQIIQILRAAAARACNVGQRPASAAQIAEMADMIDQLSNYGHPFGGNTNAILSAKKATFEIENLTRSINFVPATPEEAAARRAAIEEREANIEAAAHARFQKTQDEAKLIAEWLMAEKGIDYTALKGKPRKKARAKAKAALGI